MTTTSHTVEIKPSGKDNISISYNQKKRKQVQKSLHRKNNGCRNLHHSCHSPHLELEVCKNCDAYVEVRNHNICRCCEKPLAKFLKHTWLTRVIKFGLKQHANYIRDWSRYPDQGVQYQKLKKPYTYQQKMPDGTVKTIKVEEGFVKKPKHSQYLEIKYRDTVYEIEVKYLALALENLDRAEPELKIPGGEHAKLDTIKRHTGIKGLRIWIPDDENYEYFPKDEE